jgi:hypothetical protein
MGLDLTAPQMPPPEPATEKRRRILGALEKCDEDLKALRRIIETARLTEMRMKASETVGSIGAKGMEGADLRKEVEVEHQSPNSVLDAIYSPRFRSKRAEINGEQRISFKIMYKICIGCFHFFHFFFFTLLFGKVKGCLFRFFLFLVILISLKVYHKPVTYLNSYSL